MHSDELMANRSHAVRRYMDEVLKHLPLDVEWRMRVSDVAFVRARSKKAVTISSADVVGLLIDPVDHREMAQDILDGLGRGLKEDGYTPDWKARRVNCWAVQNPPEGLEIEVYRARLSKNGYRGQVTAKTRNRNGTLLLTDVLPTADEAMERCSGFAKAYALALEAFNGESDGTEIALQCG